MDRGGKKSNFTAKKPDEYYFSEAIKANINSNKSYSEYTPLLQCGKNGTATLDLPPQNSHLQSNHEENIKFQWRET